MKGVSKVIDELGLIFLTKDVTIESQQKEIDALRTKVELLEGYLEVYEEFYNKNK